ncbi:hypothetical protein Bpro_4429 [Polaromonas sp. JS666]|nr:hypothetical protein Bpro_4429 [Polaromonas sp. JS666]
MTHDLAPLIFGCTLSPLTEMRMDFFSTSFSFNAQRALCSAFEVNEALTEASEKLSIQITSAELFVLVLGQLTSRGVDWSVYISDSSNSSSSLWVVS